MLGLICAVPQEILHFEAVFSQERRVPMAGMDFRVGSLDGHQLVLVEAGIGKVNNAVAATLLCEVFGCRGVLFSGVAGGLDPSLGVGDVVVGATLIQHDYGAMVNGELIAYQPGIAPLPHIDRTHGYHLPEDLLQRLRQVLEKVALPPLSAAATGGIPRNPVIRFGTIVSGDSFVNCEDTRQRLYRTFGASAVEMEGAAVAQVTEKYGAFTVVVRSLSDLAGAQSHMDFGVFVAEAASTAAGLIRRLLPAV